MVPLVNLPEQCKVQSHSQAHVRSAGKTLKSRRMYCNSLDMFTTARTRHGTNNSRRFGHNLSFLKDLCDLLDIDRSTTSFKEGKVDKESISERVVNWLEKPHAGGEDAARFDPKTKETQDKKKEEAKKAPQGSKRSKARYDLVHGVFW